MLLIMIAYGRLPSIFSSVGRPVRGFTGPSYKGSEGDGDGDGDGSTLGVTGGGALIDGEGAGLALWYSAKYVSSPLLARRLKAKAIARTIITESTVKKTFIVYSLS
jgi:hypothetical protein